MNIEQLNKAKKEIERLTLANAGLNSRLSNSVDLNNEKVVELAAMRKSRNTWMKIALDSTELNNQDFDEINGLKAQVELLSNPSCGGLSAGPVSDVGWWLNGWLTDRGELNGYQFNDLKPMFCDAVKLYANKLREGKS